MVHERGHTRNICKECKNEDRRKQKNLRPELRQADNRRSASRRTTLHSTGITLAKMDELKKKYNKTPEDWVAQWASQNGCCAICKETLRTGKGGAGWDHNKKTNHIRKILCAGCNTGIGLFKEDPKRLIAAIAYLEEHNAIRWGTATVDIQRATDDKQFPAITSFW